MTTLTRTQVFSEGFQVKWIDYHEFHLIFNNFNVISSDFECFKGLKVVFRDSRMITMH